MYSYCYCSGAKEESTSWIMVSSLQGMAKKVGKQFPFGASIIYTVNLELAFLCNLRRPNAYPVT